MKLRLVRLNPLTLDPGEMFVLCGRQLDVDPLTGVPFPTKFSQFPCRLEYQPDDAYNQDDWHPVEFVNEFAQLNEDNNAREVRSEVQVPVYNGPSRNKGGRSDPGSGQA